MIMKCYDAAVLLCYSAAVLQSYGVAVLWCYGAMVIQLHGSSVFTCCFSVSITDLLTYRATIRGPIGPLKVTLLKLILQNLPLLGN